MAIKQKLKKIFRPEIVIFKTIFGKDKELKQKVKQVIKEDVNDSKRHLKRAMKVFIISFTMIFLISRAVLIISNSMMYCEIEIDQINQTQTPYYEAIELWEERQRIRAEHISGAGVYYEEDIKRLTQTFSRDAKLICNYNITKWIKKIIQ